MFENFGVHLEIGLGFFAAALAVLQQVFVFQKHFDVLPERAPGCQFGQICELTFQRLAAVHGLDTQLCPLVEYRYEISKLFHRMYRPRGGFRDLNAAMITIALNTMAAPALIKVQFIR